MSDDHKKKPDEHHHSADAHKKPEHHHSEDPHKKPHLLAGSGDSKSSNTLLYLVLGILLLVGVYLYLSSKGYLPKV